MSLRSLPTDHRKSVPSSRQPEPGLASDLGSPWLAAAAADSQMPGTPEERAGRGLDEPSMDFP